MDRAELDPTVAWGLNVLDEPEEEWDVRKDGMTAAQAGYVRFLCEELGGTFDDTLTEGEADLVIEDFMGEPMTEAQARTLEALARQAGREPDAGLTYGEARAKIRQLFALKGLRPV